MLLEEKVIHMIILVNIIKMKLMSLKEHLIVLNLKKELILMIYQLYLLKLF